MRKDVPLNTCFSKYLQRTLGVAAAIAASACLARAGTVEIDISVVQDGTDVLYLQGSTLRWQHFTEFANGNATITAFIDGVQVPSSSLPNNGVWVNGNTGKECSAQGGTLNCPVFDPNSYLLPASLALPAMSEIVTLQSLIAIPTGGSVAGSGCTSPPCTITIPTNANNQQPNSADSYTLKVALNDTAPGGTHRYDIGLTFDPVPVPEPGTDAVAGLCLLGGAVISRRRWLANCWLKCTSRVNRSPQTR